jgi:flagellar hook-associated protein 1 FlgK
VSGTFSSFNTALSALRYNRVAMDVASGNVANAGTEGYARRQVVGQATGAPAVPAMWSRWDLDSGDGVQPGGIKRMVDPLLDARARLEHAASAFLDTRVDSLNRFETALAEPGENGVAAALSSYQAGWHDIANNPGDPAARAQLIARAETLRAAIAGQDRAVRSEWADQRSRLSAAAEEVNQVAAELAKVNDGLRSSYVAETDAGVLLDQRDLLTMRLAELTGSKITINPDTTVDVTVAGQPLVTGNVATTVSATGAAELADAAGDPVQFLVGGTAVTLTAGEVGGIQSVMSSELPGYLSKLDAFVGQLVADTNTQHSLGRDLDGDAGAAFFSGTTAATLAVAISDPRDLAAGDPAKGPLDGSNATALAGLDMGGRSYRELITTTGVLISSANRGAGNQSVLVSQVDASREALSGISIDEEMVNLLAAQRGYEGASRVLTTIDSVLDTLINRTGLLR